MYLSNLLELFNGLSETRHINDLHEISGLKPKDKRSNASLHSNSATTPILCTKYRVRG